MSTTKQPAQKQNVQEEADSKVVRYPDQETLQDAFRREFHERRRLQKIDPSGNPAFGR